MPHQRRAGRRRRVCAHARQRARRHRRKRAQDQSPAVRRRSPREPRRQNPGPHPGAALPEPDLSRSQRTSTRDGARPADASIGGHRVDEQHPAPDHHPRPDPEGPRVGVTLVRRDRAPSRTQRSSSRTSAPAPTDRPRSALRSNVLQERGCGARRPRRTRTRAPRSRSPASAKRCNPARTVASSPTRETPAGPSTPSRSMTPR